jgi:tRNA A37 methylthiotransferase MiaB
MVIYPKPNECKKPRFGFSYNWALIGTILYSTNHNVIMHDYSYENFDDTIFFSQLENEKIQVVIVEFDSFALKRSENYQHGDKLVQSIRNKHPEIMIVAYGYYCCITGEDISCADVTVKENDINQILFSIDRLESKSISIEYKNFDTLPFINRSLIQTIPYFYEYKVSTLIQTAKGCENSCIFCQRKGWQSRYVPHGKGYVLSEFDTLQSQNFKNIWITDENFTFQLGRAKDILRGLIENNTTRNMKIAISSWANIDNEFLDLASQAYIKTISFGIETGNNEILQFYRKNIDLQKSKSLIKYANSIGIFTVGNFIIGAPMETIDTINETFYFIKECSFDQVNIKTLDYMIGSELHASIDTVGKGITHIFACKENGLNNFTLKEIKDIKISFITQYYKDKRQFLRQKIEKYGTPFD